MAILRTPFPIATFFDHRFKRKNRHKQLMAWTNRHGRTFCTINLLNGFRRNIVSSDPEVLAEVFGRAQFKHFPERKAFKESSTKFYFVFRTKLCCPRIFSMSSWPAESVGIGCERKFQCFLQVTSEWYVLVFRILNLCSR